MILQEHNTLANGMTIPKLGLGTWFIEDEKAAETVRFAVAMGYRLIDTAQAYGNESFSVIDTITGAATPSENGTTATTVSTAKSDAPIQIETITLTTWGETEQDAYVPENSIS